MQLPPFFAPRRARESTRKAARARSESDKPIAPRRTRSARRSDGRRRTLQLVEHRLLECGAVLLAGLIAVAGADELHAGSAMVAALLDAHGDQRAGERRGLHLLLPDHRHAAPAVPEIVGQHLDGALAILPDVAGR